MHGLAVHRQSVWTTVGRQAVAIVIATCCSLVLLTPSAEACTCFRPCGTILQAKILFEATVVAVEPDPSSRGDSLARLADVRSIRGGSTPAYVVAGNEAACGYTFKVGTRYLIDAHEFQPGRFGASLCSNTTPLDDAGGILAFLHAPSPELRPRLWGRVVTPRADQFSRTASPPLAIADAVVTASGPATRSVTTTSNGDYAFPFRDLPDGTYHLTVEIPADRRGLSAPAPLVITLGPAPDQAHCSEIRLDASSTSRVSGRVTTPTGGAAQGVRVEIFPLPLDWYASRTVTAAITDADGRYTIERLAPGRYQGGVGMPYPSAEQPFLPTRLRTADGSGTIDVALGASMELPTLVARRAPPIRATGRVLMAPNIGVADAEVSLAALDGVTQATSGNARTDAAGRFTITAHLGVRYRLEVERFGRVVATTEFVAGDAPVDVAVPPPQ